jgi:uncharacterized protein YutE (UPF0331/DUF86 family)
MAGMSNEFNGIEKRLQELNGRLTRLEPLKSKPLEEFLQDAYLRDIVERNLEVAAQACIDIYHRLIAMGDARRPADYYDAFMIVGEMGVLPADFAAHPVSVAGFRNILVHEYLRVDWGLVYANLQRLDELHRFRDYVLHGLKKSQPEIRVCPEG